MNKALVINTHSSNEDCLLIFLNQLGEFKFHHFFDCVYIFTDDRNLWRHKIVNSLPSDINIKSVVYNGNDYFAKQMNDCLSQVEESIILYCNEDYILYDKPDLDILNSIVNILNETDELSYMRLVYGPISHRVEKYKGMSPLIYIPPHSDNSFSQVASFWKTKDFKRIHEVDVPYSIGIKGEKLGHFEAYANKICADLKIAGAVFYEGNERKAGQYHYDSNILPHIASALVRGCWNCSEYEILNEILDKYNIDKKLRGCV